MASQDPQCTRTWHAHRTQPLPALQSRISLFQRFLSYISEVLADATQQKADFVLPSLRSYGLWRRKVLVEQACDTLTAPSPCQLSNHESACFSVSWAISARRSLIQPIKNQPLFCTRSRMLTFGAARSCRRACLRRPRPRQLSPSQLLNHRSACFSVFWAISAKVSLM